MMAAPQLRSTCAACAFMAISRLPSTAPSSSPDPSSNGQAGRNAGSGSATASATAEIQEVRAVPIRPANLPTICMASSEPMLPQSRTVPSEALSKPASSRKRGRFPTQAPKARPFAMNTEVIARRCGQDRRASVTSMAFVVTFPRSLHLHRSASEEQGSEASVRGSDDMHTAPVQGVFSRHVAMPACRAWSSGSAPSSRP